MCRSGSAADTQAISAYVEHLIQQHQMELGADVDVKTAAQLAMQLVYNNKVGVEIEKSACAEVLIPRKDLAPTWTSERRLNQPGDAELNTKV